jgi:hypothetical protein
MCLVIVTLVGWATEPADYMLGSLDFSGAGVNIEVSKTSPEFTSIALNSPNVVIQDQVVDFETYQVLGIEGEPFLFEEGSPTVPQITRLYRIPNTGSVELRITAAEFSVVENINPLPLQSEGSSFEGLRRNEAVYSADEWYPKEVAAISAPMIWRDFRVVTVTLYPVQVNPVTHQARVYYNLNADIVANEQPGLNELLNPHRPSGSFAPMYRNQIVNLDDFALDDVTDLPGRYMIICKTDSTSRWADSLRTWKKRRGFDVTIDARGNWTAGTMRTAIQQAYASANPPEFVALMGDPQGYGVPTDGSNYDHTFALGNNGDDIEDIGVGRLSGSTWNEMATINAKIMGYERNPWMVNAQGQPDTMWFRKAFLYAGINYSLFSNQRLMLWAGHQYQHLTDVDSIFIATHTGAIDQDLVRARFAGGISAFLWRGSYVGEMYSDFPATLPVSWRLPICLTITCNAGDFASGLGTSEAYLVAGSALSPRGGICGIGSATSSTHAPPNICFSGGLMYAIINLDIEHIGHCVNSGKLWLSKTFGYGSGEASNFSRFNNLMGDPGLSIWTAVPVLLSVNHPSTVNVGTRLVHVVVTRSGDGVPVADALVVLWKGSETYVRGLTDANGAIDLPVTVNSTGTMLLTITKRNHKPYLADMACITSEQTVALTSYVLDDDNAGGTQGNSNFMMNPGETIDLPIYLRNFGTAVTATNISATLTSNNPHVTVVNATSTFPNLAPGDSALCATNFRITVSPVMQDDEVALLTLAVTASSIQTYSAFELTCLAGKLDYVSHAFSGSFNPGDTRTLSVSVKNNGALDMSGVTAQLVSMSPFVQVGDPAGTYGNINIGQTVNNSGDQFTLTANTLTFRGHIAPMLLIATTPAGFVDSTQFTVNVGTATTTDPTGPDAYGYYAYDNTDANYEMHPTFSYINISSTGTNLNLNDPGVQVLSPVYSTVRTLPFPFTFYGVTYDSITICSNGWCAFGNQAYFDGWRNYPIPAMQAPDAVIMPYHDDLGTSGSGRGVWVQFDATNHQYIIQWKAFGATSTGTNLDFEVILLDQTEYPTLDGNGIVLIQYQTVTMNLQGNNYDIGGCTIGIQDTSGLVGLGYAYVTTYSPGAAAVQNGRAILFTTNARALFGDVSGTVINAENSLPMSAVDVTIDGYAYHGVTNAQGQYTIPNVLIGSYTVRASKHLFNDAVVNNVLVELDSMEVVNFSMLHPEIDLSVDSIHVTTPPTNQTNFTIVNGGNGPLDFDIRVAYAPDHLDDPWDQLGSISLSQITNDFLILGCEFAQDHWWVTGGGGPNGSNLVYKFTRDGALVDSLFQPGTSPFGWFDMAYDGTNLYGSDDHNLTGINLATGQIAVTIPSPLHPTRAVAYDPATDHFWVADYTADIYEINRQGDVLQQIPNQGANELAITGFAWNLQDADGYKLYIFSQNGSNPYTRVSRMHPVTHTVQTVVDLNASTGDRAGGCTITGGWNSTLLVFAGIIQNATTGDRLGIYEMTFNTTWITVAPSQGTVPGGNSGEVTINFDATDLRPDFTYRVNLTIHSSVRDTSIVMPVALTVLPVSAEDNANALPTEYALYQNYPNPFNPSTTIRYDLKAAGMTKLVIYNLMGQQAATLVNEVQPAGVYRQQFDGAALGSGVYFYRLESGDFVKVAKMVLMK